MILVDTSIWVDHLHQADSALVDLLEHAQVLTHPMVIGELALGSIRDRAVFLAALNDLFSAVSATDDEVLTFIEQSDLFGRGLNPVDVHLLASVVLTPEAMLWTRDKRLQAAATELSLSYL